MHSRKLFLGLGRWLPILLVGIAGCGPRGPVLAPVHGIVTLDGKPVENASVMFVSSKGGRPATGTTNAQGEFKLTTFDNEDGCVLGKQEVSITLKRVEGSPGTMTPEGLVSGSGTIKTTWIVPEKYSDPKTSGLVAEVVSGNNNCPFALKSE